MPDRPNIVVVLSDQHRPDALGCAGDPVVETPNLDRLADSGVRFTEAYSPDPVCVPARTSMYMGVRPHNTHVLGNDSWVPEGYTTWVDHLREAGYYTAHIGQAHQKGQQVGGDHISEHESHLESLGFEYVHETTGQWSTVGLDSYMTEEWAEKGVLETFREDYRRRKQEAEIPPDTDRSGRMAVDKSTWPSPLSVEDHMDSYVGRQAVEFVESYDRAEPLALFVGIPGPHGPMDPPGEYAEMYDADGMPAPLAPTENGDHVPGTAAETLDAAGWTPDYYTEQLAREYRAAYYGKVSLIDHWMGELLDALDAAGMRENTFTMYTADHGEHAGDHARFGKNTAYDESVRVPCLVSWPAALPEGETSDALASLIDLFPTTLDAAGVEAEAATTGQSLLASARHPDSTDGETREMVASFVGDRRTMLVTREHKYAVDGDGEGYLLVDREADPDERENLVGHPDYAEVEAEFRERLLRFYQRSSTRYRRTGERFVVED
jgi:arylsulfatase A-like enzyme